MGPGSPLLWVLPVWGEKHDKGGLFPSMLCLSGLHTILCPVSRLLFPSPPVIQL